MKDTPVPFDLDQAAVLTEAELELKHPITGVPLGIFVTLAGHEHELRKQRLFSMMRAQRAKIEKTGKFLASDPADDTADELDTLVACTLGWRNMRAGGQQLEWSAGACAALYTDPKRAWVRDQVIRRSISASFLSAAPRTPDAARGAGREAERPARRRGVAPRPSAECISRHGPA